MPNTILAANPKASYLAHKDEVDAAVVRVLESGWYILGREVAAFEEAFAGYLGVDYAVGVASGTDALELALRAVGVRPGDSVLTVSHTAVATVAAIERAGAVPILVDIDQVTYTMDPGSLAEAISVLDHPSWEEVGRPKAVVPVHLYGQPADMPAIVDIADRHRLSVVEDCAQSHGAMLLGRMAGTWGHLAAFSFYPTKNLAALGDGGLVATDDPQLADQVRLLRQYGWRERYHSYVRSTSSRLDELQAAILRVKLKYLDEENERRRELARVYDKVLDRAPVARPQIRPGARHVYHQYVVRVKRRDALRVCLKQQGIGTLIHYPFAVHQQIAYRGRLPQVVPLDHTEAVVRQVVSLPMYPELSQAQVRRAAEQVATHQEKATR